ncbi:hypothetical protein BGZ81_003026 [Podila clonocystis]|nr:hypothetical protein BGZ81_003026 [Podila clonocystis]
MCSDDRNLEVTRYALTRMLPTFGTCTAKMWLKCATSSSPAPKLRISRSRRHPWPWCWISAGSVPQLNLIRVDIFSRRGETREELVTTVIHKLGQGVLPRLVCLGLTSNVQDHDLVSYLRAMSTVVDLDCTATHFDPLATPKLTTLRTLQLKKCFVASENMILESCLALEVLESTSILARLTMNG